MRSATSRVLEKSFYELSDKSKDRAKNIKNISTLLLEVGKSYTNLSKDLSKFAATAKSNIRKKVMSVSADGGLLQGTSSGNDLLAITTTNSSSAGVNKVVVGSEEYSEDWWSVLASCLEHLCQDTEEIAER